MILTVIIALRRIDFHNVNITECARVEIMAVPRSSITLVRCRHVAVENLVVCKDIRRFIFAVDIHFNT
jgi:hypothetical protein